MSTDAWTDPDPQRGDFDADLVKLDRQCVEVHDGDPDARLRILVSVEGQDAARLERMATASGRKPSEIIAELLRNAAR